MTQHPPQKIHPSLRATRKKIAKALVLMIKQIRNSGGVWSNGQDVFEGLSLVALKEAATHRLINMRTDVREPASARMVKNLTRSVGYLSPEKGETTPDFLGRLLTKHTRGDDMGSHERRLMATRILRKHFPDHHARLPFEMSVMPKALPFAVQSLNARKMVLREELHDSSGVIFNAGTPVVFDCQGYARVRIGSIMSEGRICLSDLRPSRPSDNSALLKFKFQREDDNTPSPDF